MGKARYVPFVLMVLVASVVFSPALAARTFHVSTAGNDAGIGSEGSPWRTIQHALNEAVSGDTVLIAGGIYSEYIQSVRSGREGAPIILAARPGDVVVIDGSAVDWSTGITLNHDFIRVEGIEIGNWSSTGIWIDGAGFVELRDCLVHDCVFGIGAANGAHDFLLERVEIRAFDLYGFDASPSGGVDCYNGTFIDCVAHSTRDPEQNVDGFALGHGNQHGFRFVRCEAYGVFDGFDIGARQTTLEACSSHENGNAGFKIWADAVRLENCVAFQNGICNIELDWDGEPGTTTLRNCTLYDAPVFSIWVENAGDRLDMVNCIVSGGDNIGLAFEQATAPNYVGDHNLFQNDNPARVITVGYSDEFSLSDIAAGVWAEYSGQDASSVIAADTQDIFLSPTIFDLRLGADSPAIDAGRTAEAPSTDIAGRLRPHGAGADIGAWEWW